MRFFLIFTLALFNLNTFCQVFSWLPEYPSINDTVIITYNPSFGNGALMNTSNIYAHTGVINKYSSSHKDWKNVPIEWHEGGDSSIQLTQIGSSLFQIKFKIKSFYNVTNPDKVSRLNFIFRNDNGSISGTNLDGTEFSIPIFPTLRPGTKFFSIFLFFIMSSGLASPTYPTI